jgi:hypothetical protein
MNSRSVINFRTLTELSFIFISLTFPLENKKDAAQANQMICAEASFLPLLYRNRMKNARLNEQVPVTCSNPTL